MCLHLLKSYFLDLQTTSRMECERVMAKQKDKTKYKLAEDEINEAMSINDDNFLLYPLFLRFHAGKL